MDIEYFNFSNKFAGNWWGRSSFVRYWWRLYANDPRWVPPYYPAFRRSLEPAHNPHLNRLGADFLTVEAMPRRKTGRRSERTPGLDLSFYPAGVFEQPVATAVLLRDTRRRDRSAYLGLLHCTNDAESLERMLDVVAHQLSEEGFNQLITLSSLSPYLSSGFLQDHWDQIPPLGTPYDPPYLSELVDNLLIPGQVEHLFHLSLPLDLHGLRETAVISPVNPDRLKDDLLPLFLSVLPAQAGFPAPDSVEGHFLIKWVGVWPLEAWLATMEGKEAGFILLGPDLALALLQTKGGRSPVSRLRLKLLSRRRARQGRIYFGGVLPDYRRKGIGTQLLQKALSSAQAHCWEQLITSPVWEDSVAERFLERAGAFRGASYRHYSIEI